jgi:hypothetical protein
MPILERDPWRFQYFSDVDCPDDVIVPTDDIDAWPLNPAHNWVYDRLRVALSQGLPAAPHGSVPPSYPVFSKPVINLRGMGLGSRLIGSPGEMAECSTPGHFWMPLLEGEHVSTDCAVERGAVKWMRSCHGEPAGDGMFRHWTLLEESPAGLAQYIAAWVSANLAAYTGMLNLETIGGRIIEVHLRFSDQWCDLYGEGWTRALVGLHATGRWAWQEPRRRQGFSIPLFAAADRLYRHPPQALQERVRSMPHVSSLQITFHDGVDPARHAMPPGGLRLALVNCWNLDAGVEALGMLATWFPREALIGAPPPRRQSLSSSGT